MTAVLGILYIVPISGDGEGYGINSFISAVLEFRARSSAGVVVLKSMELCY